ncbi:hypothetical protein PFISCL1PPCAC_2339, partial [Pristionchus fissidentatus]
NSLDRYYHSMEKEPPVQSSYSNENEGKEIPSGIVQQRRALFSRGNTRRSIRGYSTMPSSWKEKKEREREGRRDVTLGESIDSRTLYSPPMDPHSRSSRVDIVGIGITATPSTILRGGPFETEGQMFRRTSDCCVIRKGSGRRQGTVWTFPQSVDTVPRSIDFPVKSETLPRRVPVREVTIRAIPTQKRDQPTVWRSEGPVRVMQEQSAVAYASRPISYPPPIPANQQITNNNREEKLDPQEIRATCEVIRESLLGKPAKSLESRLHTMEIEMAELSRALNSSQTLIDQMHSVAASGSSNYSSISGEDDDCISETNSQVISLRNQIAIHSQSLSNKDLLIKRLEKELNDAQQCNHALNSQLGVYASSPGANLKRDLNDAKKELKKKNSDYEDLKKLHGRLENERDHQRRLLDSKIPPDMQTLMAQKRELTQQLDREQSEKHELFMQINALIGQVAQSSDGTKEKEEIERLNKDIKSLESRLESEKDAVRRKSEEMELSVARSEIEKRKLAGEVESLGKELSMKGAALQSLQMIVKEPKDDGSKAELERLRMEIEEERRAAESVKKEHNMLLASSSSSSREMEEKVQILEEEMRELERKLDNSLKETAETREKINSSDVSRRELENRLMKSEEESRELNGRLERERERGNGLERRLEANSGEKGEELRVLEKELRETREKEKNLQEKMKEMEEKSRRLSESSAVELALLKKSLEEEKEKSSQIVTLESKLVVAHKERDEIERRSKELEKQNEDTVTEMKRVQSARGNVHAELMTLVKSLQESRQRNEELSSENAQLMKELNESREENEQMQEEIRVREEEIGDWKERITRAEASSSSHSASIEEEKLQMRSESEKMSKKYEELLNEAELSQKAIEELEDEKQSIIDLSREKEQQMEAAIERAIAETTSARAELTKMGLRLKDSDADARKHEGRAEELQRRIDSIMEDSEKVAGVHALEAAEKSTKMRDAEEFSRKIKKQLEELERENTEKLAEKEETHKTNVQKLSEQIADLQSKLSSTSLLLTESDSNLRRIQSELEDLKRKEMERAEKDSENSSLLNDLRAAKELAEKEKKEKEEMERKVELFMVEKSSYGVELERLHGQLSTLRSELEEEKKRPDHEPEVHRLKEVLILEIAAKERVEKESREVKRQLEEERSRSDLKPELDRLSGALALEVAAKEKLEREAREAKKELEEERRRPDLKPELDRVNGVLIHELAAKERLESEAREMRRELEDERNRPDLKPEVDRLNGALVLEVAAKEKMVKESREIKKELEEERRRPDLKPELDRLKELLLIETAARERMERDKREIEQQLKSANESHKENGHSSPVAPPRKGKDSHSSSVSSSNASEVIDQNDRVKVLEHQVAKKDRIIGVLRRKIHQQQLALL